ncbi:MAG: hypothetical protein MJ235_01295 [archaeon]|nr:hypothetical protein [archaeon]
MNKKIFAIAILILMCGMLSVSAATLEEEDFGNFTLDVPGNADFEKHIVIPAGTVFTLSDGSLSSSLNEISNDPEKTHTMWEDESLELSIEHIIFSEDNYTDCDDAMSKLFNGSDKTSDADGLNVYKLAKTNDYKYAVTKVSDGFLFSPGDEMVIVSGNDLDELKEIASSAKFK